MAHKDSIVFKRLPLKSSRTPNFSLTHLKGETFQMYNEKSGYMVGKVHSSRLIPSLSKNQLAYVKRHGTTNFISTDKRR